MFTQSASSEDVEQSAPAPRCYLTQAIGSLKVADSLGSHARGRTGLAAAAPSPCAIHATIDSSAHHTGVSRAIARSFHGRGGPPREVPDSLHTSRRPAHAP